MKTITFLGRAFVLPVMLLVFTLTSNIGNAQNPPYIEGYAPTVTPTGGFGIDGDVYANYGQLLLGGDNPYGDWIYNPGLYPGPGQGVLQNTLAALPINTANTYRIVDLTGNADADRFTTGSKFNDYINTWTWTAGSSPSKDDMQNVMIHFDYDSNGDLWFVMAGDRSFVQGTSYIDFELLQKTVTIDGNKFSTLGTQGGRTVGDLVISLAYSSGGDNPAVIVWRWQSIGLDNKGVEQFDYIEYAINPLDKIVFAASNITGPIDVPYDAFGSNTYPQYAFAEAAVNLFELIPGISECTPIATVLIKTKASDSDGAMLKDMIEPIQVIINSLPVVTVNDPVICAGDTATITAMASEGVSPYTYSWVVPDGVTDPSDVANFSATAAGDYIVTITDASGCVSEPDTATLTVNNVTPGVIAGDQTLCDPFDPAAFTSTTPGSGDGTITYQWQMSITSANEGFADIADATLATYDADVVSVPTWFRRVATSTLNEVPCADNSNVLMVAPNEIVPGVIAGDQTLCEGENPAAFTSADATGSGTIAYQWQSSTDGVNFTDIVDATNATYDEGILNASLWYKRLATSTLNDVVCDEESNIIKVTTEPCYEPLCSYTQGYYGNPTGSSCDGENTFTTYGLIQKALDYYPSGVMRIGTIEHSILISKTETDINKVIEYLPGGKASYELSANNIFISNTMFKTLYTTGKNNATINNALLAQTIVLGLNLGINSDLGDFALQEGTFATAELDGGCGSTIAKERYCDSIAGVQNEYQYYIIKSSIAGEASDVNELFALANRALANVDGNVGTEDAISLADIAKAVDMINNAFDKCRMPMGYGIEKLVCPITATTIATPILAKVAVAEEPVVIDSSVDFKVYPVPFEDVINVQYRFMYGTDVTIQVFNLQGGLIYGAVDNMYNNGEIDTKQINLAKTFDQALIVRLTTSKEKLNKTIVAKSNTQR